MSNQPDGTKKTAIKEYAGGWITERTGTDVPVFLKLAFVAIGVGCCAYFFGFWDGETTHSDRGVLVRAMNAATQSSDAMKYLVGALAVAFCVIVTTFAIRKIHE